MSMLNVFLNFPSPLLPPSLLSPRWTGPLLALYMDAGDLNWAAVHQLSYLCNSSAHFQNFL